MEVKLSPSLLRTRRYGLFWLSSLLSNIGTWMQQVAQPWILLSLSPSSFWIGLDSFTLNAPGWIFTLWGGVLADRYDRKNIILFFQVIQAFAVLAFLALLWTGALQIWMVLVISFVIGTTDALSVPALQSIIPSLVPAKDIPRAVALSSTQFNLSRVLGPALAGLLLATYGAKFCVGANLLSYLPFFFSIFWIYPAHIEKSKIHSTEPLSTGTQLSHILGERTFTMPLISVFITATLCAPLTAFTAVFVKNAFHGGASELGWAASAFGAGGVISALSLSFTNLAAKLSRNGGIFLGALLGICVIGVALAPSLPLLYFCLFLSGIAMTAANTATNARLQESAGKNTRGKVTSLFQFALRGGISLGGLLSGSLTSALGVNQAFLANGTVALLLQTGVFVLARRKAKP